MRCSNRRPPIFGRTVGTTCSDAFVSASAVSSCSGWKGNWRNIIPENCAENCRKPRPQRILAEELGMVGWAGSELARRRKDDLGKLVIAVRLGCETTLSVKAIAVRVHLGTSYTANKGLHLAMKAQPVFQSDHPESGK